MQFRVLLNFNKPFVVSSLKIQILEEFFFIMSSRPLEGEFIIVKLS